MSNKHFIINDLTAFGLSEKEARVYVSLLELEVGSANEIANKSNVNRSSVYVVLESLVEKGFVSTSEGTTVQKYIPCEPEVILQKAREVAGKKAQIENRIEEILPELNALSTGLKKRPKFRVYERPQGLVTALEETINNNQDKLVRVAASIGNTKDLLPENYWVDYVKRRHDRKIKMRGIHPYDNIAKFMIGNTKTSKYDELALVPEKNFTFPMDMAVYDDRIHFTTADEGGVTIVVQNAGMAEGMKSLFDLAFKEAKRTSVK